MTDDELMKLSHTQNAVITAPAGHGKTEMVADLVGFLAGKQLILTHTNAGVDAIKKRMIKRHLKPNRYTVLTIAAFCSKWSCSYHWTAKIDATLSPMKPKEKQAYYSQLYTGAMELFSHPWVGSVLKNSYSGIIVDEYQDCTLKQQTLIVELNRYLPVRVFGDPLQGIFGFKEPIVKWGDIPLLPAVKGQQCIINIASIYGVMEIIRSNEFNGYHLLSKLAQYESVLYLTKWERDQLAFCKNMPGIFQHDEKQDCDILFEYTKRIDNEQTIKCARTFLEFVSKCATNVTSECKSYIARLESDSLDFSRIQKHKELGNLLKDAIGCGSLKGFIPLLKWFEEKREFKFYRKELYQEMLRSVKLSITQDTNLYDASVRVRGESSLQKRYTSFKYLSSRTLLSKGLEFDCVIIDMSNELTAKEFYVAMTRAKKMIYIITDASRLILQP